MAKVLRKNNIIRGIDMKIRVVSSKDEINTIDNEEMIHLAFRPSNKDILMLAQRCKKLKAIHIPTSFMKTISNSTLMFLEMQDIKLLVGNVWGHRNNINEYYEIKPEVIERIDELKKKGTSKDEIAFKLAMETRMSTDLLKSLI